MNKIVKQTISHLIQIMFKLMILQLFQLIKTLVL